MNGENFYEQINAYLLGELSPAQAADFERALRTDGALRTHLREHEVELERLTLAVTPQVEPPVAVREKLLAAAAADVRGPVRSAGARAVPTSAGWSVFFGRALAGMAILGLLAVCAGLWEWRESARRENGVLRARVRALATENGTLRNAREESTAVRAQADNNGRDAAALREQLARAGQDLLAARNQDVFNRLQVGSLQPPPGTTPPTTAGGVALWDPQRQQGMIVVENLPVPRPDQDYQVWVADPARPQPVPSGVFHPARAGSRETLRFVTNERIERATQFMVTLERKGGVNRITGPAVLESLPRR